MAQIKHFKGLNSVSDPLRMGLSWLATATNVNITDAGAIEKRAGYSVDRAGVFTGSYATLDMQRMYLVVSGNLTTREGVVLRTGLSSAEMFWTEINEQVFFNNGVDSGVILPDNTVLPWSWPAAFAPTVSAAGIGSQASAPGTYQFCTTLLMPDGRETGASETVSIELEDKQLVTISVAAQTGYTTLVYVAPANSTVLQLLGAFTGTNTVAIDPNNLGREMQTQFMDPLPATSDVVLAWGGRIYAAQYMPADNQTVVWFSEPLGFHLFNLNSNFFMVPGHVRMLAPHDTAVIVGTDSKVYASDGKTIAQIADYGVLPGQHWAKDGDRTIFWTLRGVCAALPFTNLTERQVSVAPGIKAGGTIVQAGGQKRYVVALQQGGSAFNSH